MPASVSLRVAFALSLSLSAWAQAPDQAYRVTRESNVQVPMRDGVKLATDVFRPDAPGRFPVLLIRTPYNKRNEPAPEEVLYFAQHGYAVVVQDVRGRYGSEGEWEPFFHETEDGFEARKWAAGQPWSNGQVATYGASYLSMVQWLAAMRPSPNLKAMVSNVGPSDIYETLAWVGGSFLYGAGATWASFMTGRGGPPPPMGPPEWARAFLHLPMADTVKSAGRDPRFYRDWVAHPTYDAYWRRLRWQDRYENLDFPVLNIGGWYDVFLKGTTENFQKLRARGPARGRAGHRLVIGPWVHGSAASLQSPRILNKVDFGAQSAFNLREFVRRWLDHYVRGIDNGAGREAAVKVFTMGENAWHDYPDWPVPGTRYVPYYLGSKGRANTLEGDGTLGLGAPSPLEKPDQYVYDPADPTPTAGGATCCQAEILPWGPLDQREVERRRDVLVYTTPPLEEELRVTGPVMARLWVASSARDTDFTVKLVDVHPDGFAMNLADGILRARYRRSFEKPELLPPGRPHPLTIDLWSTSNVFKKGHRIRVEVSSSNFPRYSRNTNTGRQPETDTTWEKAHQTVFHDSRRPSHILLPVLE